MWAERDIAKNDQHHFIDDEYEHIAHIHLQSIAFVGIVLMMAFHFLCVSVIIVYFDEIVE